MGDSRDYDEDNEGHKEQSQPAHHRVAAHVPGARARAAGT